MAAVSPLPVRRGNRCASFRLRGRSCSAVSPLCWLPLFWRRSHLPACRPGCWRKRPAPQIGPVDPPDTAYYTGSLPNDPEVERGLPIIEHHRAFLPEQVDLRAACRRWAVKVTWDPARPGHAYAARSYYTEHRRRDIQQPANLLSPNYVFHLARGGGQGCKGSSFDDVVKVLRRGALSLADYAYSDACVPPAPPQIVARAHDFPC